MRNQRFATVAILAASIGIPAMVGCDKTKEEHQTEVKHPDGSVDVNKTKTVESPDGSTKTVNEHETSKPS